MPDRKHPKQSRLRMFCYFRPRLLKGLQARKIKILPKQSHLMNKCVKFDFEIDFANGGAIQDQDFRLDFDGDDIENSHSKIN